MGHSPEGTAARKRMDAVAATIGQAREAAQELVEADPDLAGHPVLSRLAADLLDEERAQFLEKV